MINQKLLTLCGTHLGNTFIKFIDMAKKMNAFMKAKEKARKSGASSFSYNGKKYKKAKTKTGMVIYKAS